MDYQSTIRHNAAQFHQNFSRGRFDDNGPLVAIDIAVDSNNVRVDGRQAFVDRIKRYEIPFPGLQLVDRIIVVEGNKAGVHYVLQGTHHGPFGDLAGTCRLIEASSGEIFEFNDAAEMQRLTTITKLDTVANQIQAPEALAAHRAVTLEATGASNPARVARVKEAVASLHAGVGAADHDALASLVATEVELELDSVHGRGQSALDAYVGRLTSAFRDLALVAEDVVAEGNRACVSYWIEGTQTGDFTLANGTTVAATGDAVRIRGIDFARLDDDGLIDQLVSIVNFDDLAAARH